MRIAGQNRIPAQFCLLASGECQRNLEHFRQTQARVHDTKTRWRNILDQCPYTPRPPVDMRSRRRRSRYVALSIHLGLQGRFNRQQIAPDMALADGRAQQIGRVEGGDGANGARAGVIIHEPAPQACDAFL